MAFTRRRVRTRAPIRRYRAAGRRSIRRRPRRKIRKSRAGNFTLLVRKSISQDVNATQGTFLQISPRLTDFDETIAFTPQFEAYRIHYIKVTVRPHFNTTAPDLAVAPYHIAPWHKPAKNINTNIIRSIDRCKTYNGTRTASRTFVPAVVTGIGSILDTGDKTILSKTSWRPRIEIVGTSTAIQHYCGLIFFPPADSVGATPKLTYEIETTMKITYYNQKLYV